MWTTLESMGMVHKRWLKLSVCCWREGVFQCAPVSCLTSLPSVMVKSGVGRGNDESSSECRAWTLCVCGFLCADFCARIFWRGFLVRIFGADFSVRIFDADFVRIFFDFGADFGADFFADFFFAGRPQGERQKKIQQKSIKKSSPKSSPKFPLQKSSPKSSPNPSQDVRQLVLTWTQKKRCGCTPLFLSPLWRLTLKVVVFLATGGSGWHMASRFVWKTSKSPLK